MTPTLPDCLEVDDLTFVVEHRPNRRTIEITVERDASLTIKTPDGATTADLCGFIEAKRDWIYRKLAEKDALLAPPVTKEFVNGEGFAYLGRNYRLRLVEKQDADIKLDHGRFCMRNDLAPHGAEVMRRWYITTGTPWLRRRVQPWSARMSIDDPEVRVMDLGYRWGSARGNRVNVHWATLQLPPTIIDYVLVHELAHLHEPNHTDTFWAHVERAMGDYDRRRNEIDNWGRNIWTKSDHS